MKSSRAIALHGTMKKHTIKYLVVFGSVIIGWWLFPVAAFASEGQNASSSASVMFHLRYQDVLVFEGDAPIPTGESVVIPDNQGVTHVVHASSVLSVVYTLDQTSDSFALSNLAYFSSFDSFLINCIDIAQGNVHACFNWQYVINGVYPFVGVDKYILAPGDDVYVYFGSQHRVTLADDTIETGEEFNVAAQNYLYTTNLWEPLSDVTVGVTQTNPTDPFSPLIIATSTVNTLGQVTFALWQPGEYHVGIAQDFYFPSTPLTVVSSLSTSTPPQADSIPSPSSSSSGGGGGGGTPRQHASLDVARAIQFLESNTNDNGSFGSTPFVSDWVAIALGAYPLSIQSKEDLINYLLADPPSGQAVTDYERRAMALMALGINPFSGTKTNYIAHITASFDGQQIGDPTLVNDDIFALFPLLKAEISQDNPMIRAIVAFILAHQQSDGSWIGGVDMTSAAIQALAMMPSTYDISLALQKAKNYLASQQQSNGGFNDNLYSTTWAMQAIAALGEDTLFWQRNLLAPDDYLALHQAADGGLDSSQHLTNRIWLTAYAIPAALKKPWAHILSSYTSPSSFTPSPIPSPSLPLPVPLEPLLATSTPLQVVQDYASSTQPLPFLVSPVASPPSVNNVLTSVVVYSLPPSPSPLLPEKEALPSVDSLPKTSPAAPLADTNTLAFLGNIQLASLLDTFITLVGSVSVLMGLYLAWKFLL